jgi:hypothetical protein
MEEIKKIDVPQDTTIEQKVEEPKEESPSIKSEENQVNWKRFREEKEKDRKAKEDAERRAKQKEEEAAALQAAMEAILNKPVPNQHEEDEDEEKRLEKKVQELLKREREKEEKERRERENKELPNKIRKEINDFDSVCTSENIDYLEYHYPEVAAGLQHMPDSFEKWNMVYRAVKRFVPYQNKNDDAKRIENNMKKPQASSPSITDTAPTGSPWKLTEERRRQNWERMQRDMKSPN